MPSESKLLGIVNKPQFDTEVFKVGKAIHFRKFDWVSGAYANHDAIITEASPLSISVAYMGSESDYGKKELKTTTIGIESVVDSKIVLKDMILAEELNRKEK